MRPRTLIPSGALLVLLILITTLTALPINATQQLDLGIVKVDRIYSELAGNFTRSGSSVTHVYSPPQYGNLNYTVTFKPYDKYYLLATVALQYIVPIDSVYLLKPADVPDDDDLELQPFTWQDTYNITEIAANIEKWVYPDPIHQSTPYSEVTITYSISNSLNSPKIELKRKGPTSELSSTKVCASTTNWYNITFPLKAILSVTLYDVITFDLAEAGVEYSMGSSTTTVDCYDVAYQSSYYTYTITIFGNVTVIEHHDVWLNTIDGPQHQSYDIKYNEGLNRALSLKSAYENLESEWDS